MNDLETTASPAPETAPETPDETSESPTYKQDQWYGLEHYVCLLCGHEDWSLPTLTQHMQAYHQGHMVLAPEGYEPPVVEAEVLAAEEETMGEPRDKPEERPEHPHGGPPGQTGDHPHEGPPGQDKPDEDEPHPTHPIVEPDEDEDAEDKD